MTKLDLRMVWDSLAPDPYALEEPHCDLCGALPDPKDPSDWNGETGCHRACEDAQRRPRRPEQRPAFESSPGYRRSMREAGRSDQLR